MNARPLVAFTVCWVCGCAAAAGLTGRGTALAGGALAAALLLLLLARRTSWPLAAACLAAFALAAGERIWADSRNVTAFPALLAAAEAAVPPGSASFAAEAEGTVASAVEIDGDRAQFTLAATSVRAAGQAAPRNPNERLLVQVKLAAQQEQEVAASWKRGDRVKLAGELAAPGGATNFGGFDYGRYLRSQRIHWLLKADGAASVAATAGPRLSPASLLGLIDDMRAALGARMDRLYPENQSGYMKGLVLGISDDLDPTQYQQFSQLGLTHILAVSGMHVAIFLYVLALLLRLLRLTRERMLLIMIAAVPFYVLLAGGSPSVIRAGIMAVLGLAAARLNKLKDGLHLLAAAALLMLAWDPYLLENVGFQLSFLVTAGLIVGVAPFRRLLPAGKRMKALFDLLAVSIVAQAVSFPLTVYYFNQFHLLSLPANIVLVPFISAVVMPLGGASLILDGIWHPAAAAVAWLAKLCNDLSFGLVLKLAAARGFRLIWATPPLWWVACFYGSTAFILALLDRTHGKAERTVRQAQDMAEDATVPSAGHDGAGPRQTRTRDRSDSQEDVTQPLTRGGRQAAGEGHPFSGSTDLQGEHTGPLGSQTGPLAAASGERRRRSSGLGAAPSPANLHSFDASPLLRIFGGAGYRNISGKALWAIAAMTMVLPLLWAYFPQWNDNNAYVSFIDVGQGDSVLIRTASGKHILIDGGGAVSFRKKGDEWRDRRDPFEVGRKVVVPLLQQRGVHQIDLLVATHLDSDHIKGLKAVIDSVPVKGLLWNGSIKRSDDAEALLGAAVEQGIPLYPAKPGLSWQLDDDALLQLIGPPPPEQAPQAAVPVVDEQNGESVALLLTLYDRTFLLTGDADTAEERAMLALLAGSAGANPPAPGGASAAATSAGTAAAGTTSAGTTAAGTTSATAASAGTTSAGTASAATASASGAGQAGHEAEPARPASSASFQRPIDVMKVSHHGSKTSSSPDWLAFWQPHAAVISVGRNNVYGHPTSEVLQRLDEFGIDVKRTDLDGEVEFRVGPDSRLYARSKLSPGGEAPGQAADS